MPATGEKYVMVGIQAEPQSDLRPNGVVGPMTVRRETDPAIRG